MEFNQIKSFEEACELKGYPTALPDVSTLPTAMQQPLISEYKMWVIAEAINADWEPNWNDHNQKKWIPWPDVVADAEHPEGVGFSGVHYGYTDADTGCGSRLSYCSEEAARYAFETFEDLYKDFWLKKKA